MSSVVARESTVATTSLSADIGNRCPLTGKPGIRLRTRTAADLIDSYSNYLDMPLSEELKTRYFDGAITEYYCQESDLRWYSPTRLGESDFYQHLGTFPGYYDSETWDKLRTLEILQELECQEFVDVGCGTGLLLKMAADRGVNGFGLEINDDAVSPSVFDGPAIYSSGDPRLRQKHPDILVSLQTLEHVHEPVEWLASHLQSFQPRYVILAVPCHDTMLGRTTDPLVWPPHHATLWSGKALRVLSARLGYEVMSLEYEPNSWGRLNFVLEREPETRKLQGLPRFPKGRAGLLLFRVLNRFGVQWASRAHTALVVLKKC